MGSCHLAGEVQPSVSEGGEGRGLCHDVCKQKITQTYVIKRQVNSVKSTLVSLMPFSPSRVPRYSKEILEIHLCCGCSDSQVEHNHVIMISRAQSPCMSPCLLVCGTWNHTVHLVNSHLLLPARVLGNEPFLEQLSRTRHDESERCKRCCRSYEPLILTWN